MDINLGLSAVATGVDTITATYSPAPTLVDKKILFLRTAGTNTNVAPTFNPNGLGALTIVKNGGDALSVGDLDGDVILMYDLTNTRWELLTPKKILPVRYEMLDATMGYGTGVTEMYLNEALTAPRVLNLPSASAFSAGTEIVFVDEIGGITNTNTITITRDGADKINGVNTFVLRTANATFKAVTDGISKWTGGTYRDKTYFDSIYTTNSNLVSQLASYNNLSRGCYIISASATANTYMLVSNGNVSTASGASFVTTSGTSLTIMPALIYIASADYPSVNGLTPKLRIRANVLTNNTAPTGNFTFGLYPLTAPASSGGAGLRSHTIGTVVTGSDGATQATPAANTNYNLAGSDFSLPSDGWYVVCILTTATAAASSYTECVADLQITYK